MTPPDSGAGPLIRRWAEIDALFEEALSLPPARRTAFVRKRCSGDEELHTIMESLLEGTGAMQDFLDRPAPPGPFSEKHDLLLGSMQGIRLGVFQLEELIGRGGLGVVYSARRVAGDFEQKVAVKLLLDPRGDEVIRRFEREREILASLSHPGIATLLDGGTAPDGRPYFVLEFVDGQPIDRYCEDAELGIRERLALFLRVCDSVAAAHGHLVVHRDLKPSNILVTRSGDPKLLDFGIAKILDPEREGGDAAGRTAALTQTGIRAMSPAYASPEQVAGAPVGIASDVFQLGTLLYQLLAGRRPHADAGTTPAELVPTILDVDPLPPSRSVAESGVGGASQARVSAALRGDLDTIIMKALRKEPSHRYRTVVEFSDDLRRHLDGMPVRARAASASYRLGKFTRRHRLAVVVTGLLFLGGIGGVAGLVAHSTRVESERDRAQFQAERAEAVNGFLMDLFEDAGQSGARDTLTIGALLALGEERLGNRAEDPPLVRIELLDALRNAYDRTGFDGAEQRIDGIRLAAVRDHYGPAHPETARALVDFGVRRVAFRHWNQAVEVLEEGVGVLRALPMDESASPGNGGALRRGLYALSIAYRNVDRTDEALAMMREYLELSQSGEAGEDGNLSAELASLAYILRGQERYEEAAELYRRAIALGRSSEEGVGVSALNNYASLLRVMGRPEEAEPLLQESRGLLLPAEGEEPDLLLDVIHINLVDLLSLLGRDREAISLASDAHAMLRATYPSEHWRVGRSAKGVGVAHMLAGDCPTAEPHFLEATRIYEVSLGQDHPWTADSQSTLARCLIQMGRLEEAEKALLASRAILAGGADVGSSMIRRNLEELVRLYEAMARPDDEAYYRALLGEIEGRGGVAAGS